ncbi:MAG TPA: hypothetical protein DCP08_06805 [Chloroflexi bacterium]|nr:hypothetical protein [Chloroflexota bacterium]
MKTHGEEILVFLEREKSGYCDDCLAEKLGIQPRQQVNAICRRLAEEGIIARERAWCNRCERWKIHNYHLRRARPPREEARPEAPRPPEPDSKGFEKHVKVYFERELSTNLSSRVPLRVGKNLEHKFDLVSSDGSIVIECKSYTWTRSGNWPSAKIAHANQALFYLSRVKAARKLLVMRKDLNSRGDSLVETYVRRYQGLMDDVEIWSFVVGESAQDTEQGE